MNQDKLYILTRNNKITMIPSKKKKGAISALPELILMIFALALGVLLFTMAMKFGPGVTNSFLEDNLIGDPDFVSENLAMLAKECWIKNKKGKAPENDLCVTLQVNCTDNFTESGFNEYLNCKYLPNNYLNLEDKTDDDCGEKDKVYWEIYNKDTELRISYSASKRRIEIIETEAICIGICCVRKCDERCHDMTATCDETHSKCSGPICDQFYEQCKKIASQVCSMCEENCEL